VATTLEPPRVATPPPGIHRDIPFDDYWSWDCVNHSILHGFTRTPAHVRYELDHGGKTPTSALDLGWLTHIAVLEPERYDASVVVPPKVDRRTNVGKARWAQFCAANEGKLFLPADDMAAVQGMRESVLAHRVAGPFFRGKGANELSIIWEEKGPGVLCKARLDRVSMIDDWSIVGDLKTSRNASRRTFEKDIHTYGYHTQAIHYLKGLEALVPATPFRRFLFFVVESDPPHCVAVYELNDETLAQAEQERQRYLRTWKRCVETGVFPGYPDKVELCGLPAWAYRPLEDLA
jgi:PDDEXK-like uncharacterized protein DUF3799